MKFRWRKEGGMELTYANTPWEKKNERERDFQTDSMIQKKKKLYMEGLPFAFIPSQFAAWSKSRLNIVSAKSVLNVIYNEYLFPG